jgi:RecA-family ATPase
VIVAGAPGHGKSQLAALIAALASRGALPGDVNEPSRVLMMCAEDDLGDTVVPRLMAVNADLRWSTSSTSSPSIRTG